MRRPPLRTEDHQPRLKTILPILLVLLTPYLMTSCGSSTQLRAEWKDTAYADGRIQHVMVIGVFERDIVRRLMEDELVRQFESRGVRATSAASVLTKAEERDRQTVEQQVAELGIDLVLVSRLQDVEKEAEIVQAMTVSAPKSYYNSLYSYYYTVYDEVNTEGYTVEKDIVVLESNLFDVHSGEPIWIAVSESFDPRSTDKAIEHVVKLLMKSLENNGLL